MSKYNNEILDSIYERCSKFNNENTLSLKESKDEYVLMMKKGAKIHIKSKNRGKFTTTKKRTGKTAEELVHSKNPLTRKRAQFELNARKWNHKK